MRVRNWEEILSSVIESDHDPEGWRAIAGQRATGVGEDFYLGHPAGGVFHLKTYAKNPAELRGVGTQIARRVDEDLEPLFPNRNEEEAGRFAVQQAPEDESEAESMAKELEETLKVHSEVPTSEEDFFTDVMEAIGSPAFGPMEYELRDRPDRLDKLADTFDEAESVLDSELEELIETDAVDRGFE